MSPVIFYASSFFQFVVIFLLSSNLIQLTFVSKVPYTNGLYIITQPNLYLSNLILDSFVFDFFHILKWVVVVCYRCVIFVKNKVNRQVPLSARACNAIRPAASTSFTWPAPRLLAFSAKRQETTSITLSTAATASTITVNWYVHTYCLLTLPTK